MSTVPVSGSTSTSQLAVPLANHASCIPLSATTESAQPTAVSAPTALHRVGVTEDDLHALDRHLDEVGHHLREARLVPLPARLRADDHVDAAFGAHGDLRLLLRSADGGLDIICEAEAEQPAALPR